MTINTIIIDIETLDTTKTAVILSIGAFAFDKLNLSETQKRIENAINANGVDPTSFYSVFDITDQIMIDKRTISQNTIDWWGNRTEDAQIQFICNYNKSHLKNGLEQLIKKIAYWKESNKNIAFYFRGYDFDASILEDALLTYDLLPPWKFNQKRDIRTYIDALTGSNNGYIENSQPCFRVVKHNALHDTLNDAEQMCMAYNINKTRFQSNLDH